MKGLRITAAALMLLLAAGFGFSQAIELVGAGATFPAPFYSKVFDEYAKQFGVKVNYQAIGSGGGQSQIKAQTVDFGASDVVMLPADMKAAPGTLVHIPMVAGATVITYNLPGSPELKFTPDVIADMFLGKINRWNDPRIVALNPSVNLPKTSITVVHRSDGSGTTGMFSDYLSKVSPDWKTKVGVGTALNWPVGIGGKGNPGVAGLVKQLPGAMGYVELIYALQNNLPYATVRNSHGNWIKPSLASTTLAANVKVPADVTQISLTDTDAPNGYPISTFTWLLVYVEQNYNNRTQAQAEALVKMLWWMTHDAQKYAEALSYATLPPAVVAKAETIIHSITYNGVSLMQ